MPPQIPVTVVDDGSLDAGRLAAAAGGATVLRHERPLGPAAARNRAWRHVETPLVAFVDDDVVLPPGGLERLAAHFEDAALGAVAPRIASDAGPGTPVWLAAYEEHASPLDLGPWPSPVRPRSAVPYVPTPVLIVRRRALEAVGGFDEALRSGEDVDLVWRLHAAGWRIRYAPEVAASHPARPTVRAWLRQRTSYGRAAAPLERRHGEAVAPLRMGLWPALTVAGLLLGRPLAAATAAGLGVAAATRVDDRLPPRALIPLALRAQLEGLGAAGDALRRAWWPLSALAAITLPRSRPALAAATVIGPLVTWVRRRPDLDPLRWLALSTLDDLAYGAGVWQGVHRERRYRALLPARASRRAHPARHRPQGP